MVFQKAKHKLTYDPAIPLLGVHKLKELKAGIEQQHHSQ
jgi:hypothetical protein